MAHMLMELDRQEGIEMAWHGLTKVNPNLSLKDNVLQRWNVIPVELQHNGSQIISADNGFDKEANDAWRMLKCTDQDVFIGQPFRNSYTPLDNEKFLEIAEKAMAGTDHKLVSAGSVCNRARIFLSFKLVGLMEMYKAAGREFEPYFNMGSSHDQSCVFYVNTSNICTVCNNTFTMNLAHKGKMVNARIKHTKNMDAEISNMQLLIETAIGIQFQFAHYMNEWNKMPETDNSAREIFAGFLKPDFKRFSEDENGKEVLTEVPTRTRNTIDRLSELFNSKEAGNDGNDRSDVFSAGTDYFSHESAGTDIEKQFISSEFGSGLKKKQDMFDILSNPNRLAKTREVGKLVLANM